MATVGVERFPPGTTENWSEVTAGVSLVVLTESVLVPKGALVMPRRVIWSSSPGLTNASVLKKQLTARLGSALLQPPTFWARVTSRMVAPFQPASPVPAGSWIVMRLLAAFERPPGAETLNPIT